MTNINAELSTTKVKDTSLKGQRSLEHILDEYKIIALKLFEFSDTIVETEEESTLMAKEQARLLDKQQTIICEACSMKIHSPRDANTLVELWKADEIHGESVSPSQRLILNVNDYLLDNIN